MYVFVEKEEKYLYFFVKTKSNFMSSNIRYVVQETHMAEFAKQTVQELYFVVKTDYLQPH